MYSPLVEPSSIVSRTGLTRWIHPCPSVLIAFFRRSINLRIYWPNTVCGAARPCSAHFTFDGSALSVLSMAGLPRCCSGAWSSPDGTAPSTQLGRSCATLTKCCPFKLGNNIHSENSSSTGWIIVNAQWNIDFLRGPWADAGAPLGEGGQL